MIAFALLWRSATGSQAVTFGLGMAVFSLALAARAGPFFMLPALLFWAVVSLGSSLKQRVILGAAGVLGVACGQSVPRFFNMYWGDGGNSLYSNFAFTIYGMTAGGKRWTAVKTEHPELLQTFSEGAERAARIYQLAF